MFFVLLIFYMSFFISFTHVITHENAHPSLIYAKHIYSNKLFSYFTPKQLKIRMIYFTKRSTYKIFYSNSMASFCVVWCCAFCDVPMVGMGILNRLGGLLYCTGFFMEKDSTLWTHNHSCRSNPLYFFITSMVRR